jgi:hypothetical protein
MSTVLIAKNIVSFCDSFCAEFLGLFIPPPAPFLLGIPPSASEASKSEQSKQIRASRA